MEALQRIGCHGNIITDIQTNHMTCNPRHISSSAATDSDLPTELRSSVDEEGGASLSVVRPSKKKVSKSPSDSR